MKAYSAEFRARVFADAAAGLKTKAIAEKYDLSPAIVRRWKQRFRESGETGPRKSPGRPRTIDRDCVAAAARSKPDATLAELRRMLGLKCSLQALHSILRALRITFKKNDSRGGAGSSRRRNQAHPVARQPSRHERGTTRLHR
jgi:transposase